MKPETSPQRGAHSKTGNHARKEAAEDRGAVPPPSPLDMAYETKLRELQLELVKLQRHVISARERILIILEGRDAAGKDGTIKRIVEHMSPRETKVVALGKPSDREQESWYFQRWVPHLPVSGEIVLFNRSWFNRAGVETVMGYCTPQQREQFLRMVPGLEEMLVDSGIRLFKYYLDISKSEQSKRLESRKKNPLKQWKISPIDEVAHEHWKDYSNARNEMLTRTHTALSPWTIVRADDKKSARLNLIRDLLSRMDYDGKHGELAKPDHDVVFGFDLEALNDGRLAP